MAIQIGSYKRPGIFQNEYDKSAITVSPVVTGSNVLVVGFSKKGPFNTAVQLTNTTDLTNIFGDIDRSLERKSSFFHRTITKMLQSTPVYALNLLATDDTLDTVQYESFSAASDKTNSGNLSGPYRKIFNTAGFWKRSTDSFIELTKSNSDYNEVAFSFTNLSSDNVTIFVFKSQVSGYDSTLLQWYGTADNVPSYLNQNDYASDYLVDVLIVSGDWSNYSNLSVDPRWSSYFDSTGLYKDKVSSFANNSNVNTLKFYQGLSLIPYFKNLNGNDIFIENVINLDTDSTGVFCAYNIDIVETDYPTGMLDLIGNNLVGTEKSTIDFLSYNDKITEYVPYSDVYLDRPGNTWAIISNYNPTVRPIGNTQSRFALYSEGIVNGVTYSLSTSTSSVSFNLSFSGTPYAVIGGNEVLISTTYSNFSVSTSAFGATGATYTSTLVLHDTGVIELLNGTTPNVNPLVLTSDIVLGYAQIYYGGNYQFTSVNNNELYIGANGYNDLVFGVDYNVSQIGNNLSVTFTNTAAAPSLRNYSQYRKFKYFNYITSLLSSASISEMSVIVDFTTLEKKSLKGSQLSNLQTSTLYDKSFQLSGLVMSGTSSIYPDLLGGNFTFYGIDDEFILGTQGLSSKDSNVTKSAYGPTMGIAAKFSSFYLDYYNGVINNKDYFYSNIVTPTDSFNVTFVVNQDVSYIVLKTTTGSQASGWPRVGFINSGDTLIFPDSSLNTGTYEILDVTNHATYSFVGGIGDGTDGVYAFVSQNLVNSEYLPGVEKIFSTGLKHYVSVYIDNSNDINVRFTDINGNLLPIDAGNNYNYNEFVNDSFGFSLISDKLNYRETLDIVYPSGYTQSSNKILIEASRYTEVQPGDFLQAYVDTSSLQNGEVPRNLTRILTKKVYAGDTTLVELTCDSSILTYTQQSPTSSNVYFQATKYTPVEDYVKTLKGSVLKGFKVRQESMPDGTEATQNKILNLVASGTPLFNSLINKNALDIRYLVDSFGLGLTENSKQQLVDICGARLDCFGFLNVPSIKQFSNSTNPSFTNDGVIDTSYIANGGDPNKNPSFYYSLGTGAGSTSVGYFMPWVTIGDNGRPVEVPPAMFVASTYIRKLNSNISSIVPWTIAAGVTNGKVSGFTSLEMDFSPTDIENLNGAQLNPIVYKRNRGYVIETENTAQVLYKSALSYIHVREVLIELERELAAMLLDFQWKFNTSEIRSEIKLRADVICEQYVNKNGLYTYFNKCDDENNTTQIIDSQIGVLDTYVEPIRGMGIIVNNITILRTGAINSGGFQ